MQTNNGDGTPEDGEVVEIEVNGDWLRARFFASDNVFHAGMEDEIWWMDYFALDGGDTIPDDVQSGGELPRWRRIG